jgi:hypothetical protein
MSNLGFNTNLILLMHYQTPALPLCVVIRDFCPHLRIEAANRRAGRQNLPFACFKADGQKSEWLVHISSLAAWIDSKNATAISDWKAMNLSRHCDDKFN